MLEAQLAWEPWARLSLGFLVAFFGLNGVLSRSRARKLRWVRVPSYPPAAEKLRQAFDDSGYLQPCWKAVEFLAAGLMIINHWVPFALVILAPVLVNIFLFHLFLARRGLGLAIVLVALEGALAWAHEDAFKLLFN